MLHSSQESSPASKKEDKVQTPKTVKTEKVNPPSVIKNERAALHESAKSIKTKST
jgi:hypothetical protein